MTRANLLAGSSKLETCSEEKELSLHMEPQLHGDAIVLHCKGRIIFRDEAAALSRTVGELLQRTQNLILDLGGVDAIDSAGLGELVLLHMWAEGNRYSVKLANPTKRVRHLLRITNLALIFEIHDTVEEALAALQEKMRRSA
jgi:anti-sigma B factor antagonist